MKILSVFILQFSLKNEKLFLLFNFVLFYMCNLNTVNCLKYNTISLSDLSVVTEEGEKLFASLTDKVNIPHYGTCWKNAISNLEQGCKFLTEDVLSDLAFRFTDCFLQMSGYEPIKCKFSKDICLKKLTDRAFNAYTEFYTHTQSICFFLQIQVWHEEIQKTIDELSYISSLVTTQLKEAVETQQDILDHQKESLLLEHQLLHYGKNISASLEVTQDKISKLMIDLEINLMKQSELLNELFKKLSVLRSWMMNETFMMNSLIYYALALVATYFFTSIPRTQQARLYIKLCLALNYLLERFISLYYLYQKNSDAMFESLSIKIWFLRYIVIFISILLLIYSTMIYCDYNTLNHKLLLEVKNQNMKILNDIETYFKLNEKNSFINNTVSGVHFPQFENIKRQNIANNNSAFKDIVTKNFTVSPILCHTTFNVQKSHERTENSSFQSGTNIDDIDNVSFICEKQKLNMDSSKREISYNLRSSNKCIKK